MPQMDDKVQVYFGRIPPAVWDRISERPGITIDNAVAALAAAIDAGETFRFPPSLRSGITKKVYVMPETRQTLNRLAQQTGVYKTPIILTALDLYLGSPVGEGVHPTPNRTEKQ